MAIIKYINFWKKPYILSPEQKAHEFIENVMSFNYSIRNEWIYFMGLYYRRIFPGAPEKCYYIWAESTVDRAVVSLGDYFSRSHYD
jgi:hypothetical protein